MDRSEGGRSFATDSLELLFDKDDTGVGWVTETGTRAESTAPELANIIIPVHEMYAKPRATQKLIDDASIDIEAWLAEKAAERFARLEATAFGNGNGVGQPRGFLTYDANAINTNRTPTSKSRIPASAFSSAPAPVPPPHRAS